MTNLKSSFLMLVAMVVVSIEFHGSTGEQYVVGNDYHWKLPPGETFYILWSRLHIFKRSDVLVFIFNNTLHNVAEVTKEAYEHCNATNPISLHTTSPTELTIKNMDNHYYICTIGDHCMQGQKVGIKVSPN
ncbi:unnamed protein product [Lactuca saligna]|uniref:Phytocyanin domain-containing protein n=1 Tax=Lactuca saligna TaxID=75948 RepID=A0AA35ZTE0_LACSI|nr:unnamed protein product [Lactuca saligna]